MILKAVIPKGAAFILCGFFFLLFFISSWYFAGAGHFPVSSLRVNGRPDLSAGNSTLGVSLKMQEGRNSTLWNSNSASISIVPVHYCPCFAKLNVETRWAYARGK